MVAIMNGQTVPIAILTFEKSILTSGIKLRVILNRHFLQAPVLKQLVLVYLAY